MAGRSRRAQSIREGALHVVIDGAEVVLTAGRTWLIGRDPSCDLCVDDPLVSRVHAELSYDDGAWTLCDRDSTNGSWLDGARVTSVRIDRPMSIGLGRSSGIEVVLRPTAGAPDARDGTSRRSERRDRGGARSGGSRRKEPTEPVAQTRHFRIERELSVGRAPDNDVVLRDLLVSRHHAVVRRIGGDSFEIEDRGSTNGTFVNGQQVHAVRVEAGDLVSIGRELFRLTDAGLEACEETRADWLCALDVVTRSAGRLNRIRFALEPGQLLGLVGPSGAGKTTLLRALAGQRSIDEGTVLYAGRELCASLDLRRQMGYVPQEDLLHPQLTVRQALDYAAEFRFARDVEPAARTARVDEVLHELALEANADQPIQRLSGGQRKRTSVAAELLTKPRLLFLDEPTSGLDPANEDQVTALMHDLARGRRTVVVSTHSLVTLGRCDRALFLARGGHQAFYGPPGLALEHFRAQGLGESYSQIYAALDTPDGEALAAGFARAPIAETYVEGPVASALQDQSNAAASEAAAKPRSDVARQWWVLLRRSASVLKADRLASAILLAQAPFFAALFNILYPFNVMSSANASEATILVWLMVLGATWIGTSNAVREVVKEQPILRREYGLGMALVAYAASKVALLALLTAAECAFLAIATIGPQHLPAADPILGQKIPGSGVLLDPALLEVTLDVVLAGLAAMAVGLLVSALVRNADQANYALPLILVAQVVLSAPILGSPGPVFAALGTASTAQWGTAAAGSTISLNEIRRPYLDGVEQQRAAAEKRAPDPAIAAGRRAWDHEWGTWLGDVGALVATTLAALVGLYIALRLQLANRRWRRPGALRRRAASAGEPAARPAEVSR